MKKQQGFTLIELLVVIVIIGLLAHMVYPSYLSYIHKSRRTDATTTLVSIQLAEEKYRYNNNQYGDLSQVWGEIRSTTGGYYTLDITDISSTSYTITAAAVGEQANDAEGTISCASMQLSFNNGIVTRVPKVCWH